MNKHTSRKFTPTVTPRCSPRLLPCAPCFPWFLLCLVCVTTHAGELKLGTAAVPINPPPGIGLAGYYHERGHEGVLDDILAKATVLDDGSTRAAIVVATNAKSALGEMDTSIA